MTTRSEPLCKVKGCPHPSDPDWHRCFVCGKEPIDHQHFPKKSLAGKGAKIVAALCRRHHELITLNKWREGVYMHPDGSRRYYVQNEKGVEQCERIIEAAPELKEVIMPDEQGTATIQAEPLPAVKEEAKPTDLSQYSDEQLATLFAWADKQQKDSFLTKCHVIHAYRERHVQAWGDSWIEQAYQLFEGSPSRRTLEAYANIWICVTSDASLLEHVGPLTDSRSLMQFIGRKAPEDGRVALEAAVAHVAEFGEPPTVPALQHRLGEEKAETPERCPSRADGPHEWLRVCKWCKAMKER